ncbi:hypothetical protein NL676_020440 [Syzygium grande]|nr:hypothetical protein NL676_020440 [Syzygium grande]
MLLPAIVFPLGEVNFWSTFHHLLIVLLQNSLPHPATAWLGTIARSWNRARVLGRWLWCKLATKSNGGEEKLLIVNDDLAVILAIDNWLTHKIVNEQQLIEVAELGSDDEGSNVVGGGLGFSDQGRINKDSRSQQPWSWLGDAAELGDVRESNVGRPITRGTNWNSWYCGCWWLDCGRAGSGEWATRARVLGRWLWCKLATMSDSGEEKLLIVNDDFAVILAIDNRQTCKIVNGESP